MNIMNVEFKAKIDGIEKYESKLLELDPVFHGTDHQVDTYFNANHGRLKLREGNIENALINYDREDFAGSKESKVILYQHEPDAALKEILTTQLGVKVIVDKNRKIYFINNVKFHFDVVEHLGTFLEVEAISKNDEFSTGELKLQCEKYFKWFGLSDHQIIDRSYSDLLLERGQIHQ